MVRKAVRLLGLADGCWRGDVLAPFALEEFECIRTGEDGVPAVHLWRHERAVVLGLRDRKLPAAEEAIAWLERQGYSVGVRHSGGAAVPLDEGVLNVTLILPKEAGRFGLREEFRLMADVIGSAVRACGLELRAGEVAGSYCPGEFDLSVEGRKFCGIAQRRLVRSVAVQAFVNVTGSGAARASLIRGYYERAGMQSGGQRGGRSDGRSDERSSGGRGGGSGGWRGERYDGRTAQSQAQGDRAVPSALPGSTQPPPPFSAPPPYPEVREESTASLEELLRGETLAIREFADLVKRAIAERLGEPLQPCEPAAGPGEIRSMTELMRRRYGG